MLASVCQIVAQNLVLITRIWNLVMNFSLKFITRLTAPVLKFVEQVQLLGSLYRRLNECMNETYQAFIHLIPLIKWLSVHGKCLGILRGFHGDLKWAMTPPGALGSS